MDNDELSQLMLDRHIYDFLVSMKNYKCIDNEPIELELANSLGYSFNMKCVNNKLTF